MSGDRYASEHWSLRKPAVTSSRGVVTSQHYIAANAGARALRAGGNAVDAAVVTSFVLAAVEPWMSGLGGCGSMLIRRGDQVHAIDCGVVSPRRLDPGAYPLAEGCDSELFGWPNVTENRNVVGPASIAVPGQVAGMAHALEHFGTWDWHAALAPAIEAARGGLPVDWHATVRIAAAARDLRSFDASAALYLPDGLPPAGAWQGSVPRRPLPQLVATLERLADSGPQDFYTGALARSMIADLHPLGCVMDADDLADYAPVVSHARCVDYRDACVYTVPGLNGGPTLNAAIAELGRRWSGAVIDARYYAAVADALASAWHDRLDTLGASGDMPESSCTTHINVCDSDGTVVSLTQTLLSAFGSKVTLPSTGMLMNNGIMWFDPRPGRANSIRPGARPLANMCPALVRSGKDVWYALGASGGRRIIPAIAQLIGFIVDAGMDIETALHHPRIDVSGSAVVGVDARLDPVVRDSLKSGHEVAVMESLVYPNLFACPSSVALDGRGSRCAGVAFVQSPVSAAVGA